MSDDPSPFVPPVCNDVWEVMNTSRAIRRLRPDPVDDAVLARCLEAATWAPSGGNQQPWRFLVMRDAASREVLALGAQRALANIVEVYRMERPAADDLSNKARNARAVFAIHDGAGSVPAAVLFCSGPQPGTPLFMEGASIFPAMENFLLAARACGLGTVTTGWQHGAEPEFRQVLGIPDDWRLAGLVIVGWPEGRHGPVRRKPMSAVTFADRWGEPFTSPVSE